MTALVASSCSASDKSCASDAGTSASSSATWTCGSTACGASARRTRSRRSAPDQPVAVSSSCAAASARTRPLNASANAGTEAVRFSVWRAIAWTTASVFLTRWLSSPSSSRCRSSAALRSVTSRNTTWIASRPPIDTPAAAASTGNGVPSRRR